MRALVIAASFLLSTPFLLAGDDLLLLHDQVQDLTDKVSKLQLSLDENIGVMTDLVNRNAETTRSMEHDVEQLQNQTQQQNTLEGTQFGKISSQVTTLQTELGELESRLEAVTRAPLTPAPPQAQPAAVSVQAPPVQPPPAAQAPPAEPPPTAPTEPLSGIDLYRSAMDHYAAKDFEIAASEFTKFLKTDRQSDNAINAQFYLAEIEYDEKDFEGALDDYTAVGPRLSDQAKAARAQYRKALCLIEVDRQDEAILELQAVKERYPHSNEAAQAARKLHTLGVRGTPRP
ncbi:MAG: tetratricopeptide repeat protein [Terriglobales bacterium]